MLSEHYTTKPHPQFDIRGFIKVLYEAWSTVRSIPNPQTCAFQPDSKNAVNIQSSANAATHVDREIILLRHLFQTVQ